MEKNILETAERGGSEFTAQPLNVPTANASDSDWRRLPRPKARLAGLSRTTWNELLDSRKVNFVTIRKRNAKRGIKLIHWPSAQQFLKSLLAEERIRS